MLSSGVHCLKTSNVSNPSLSRFLPRDTEGSSWHFALLWNCVVVFFPKRRSHVLYKASKYITHCFCVFLSSLLRKPQAPKSVHEHRIQMQIINCALIYKGHVLIRFSQYVAGSLLIWYYLAYILNLGLQQRTKKSFWTEKRHKVFISAGQTTWISTLLFRLSLNQHSHAPQWHAANPFDEPSYWLHIDFNAMRLTNKPRV